MIYKSPFLIVFVFLLSLPVFGGSAVGDDAVVRQAISDYVDAFNRNDWQAVGAMWSEDGSHVDRESGERTVGRDAVMADIHAAVQQRPDTKLAGTVDHLRQIRPDVYSVVGTIEVQSADLPQSVSDFSAILVNEDSKWVIDSIEETPHAAPKSSYEALQELEWLVGKWVDEADSGRVETTFRWTANQAFLLRSFVVRGADQVTGQGTQVIGWDPRSQEIRSWAFSSDGAFGDATWVRTGNQWLIRSSQTVPDGRAASGTYVLTKVDDQTMTLQLIGHDIEGEPQPTEPAVTVVRVADQPQSVPDPSANNPR
ncbi:hypothetical protein K227x_08460 [Rubripirellula lacrimiformis]|uniref:DUF4440 domain-containing protein n=1 Tax=Rubripirellula lacrimiformis TaxID=1930273 RepID=A0A517N5Q6_9BACT|nr:nuclear transport factor 2 family protein [Rubripirellula lacrimiformis]QDT02469.1 hypothetical protein K227x_08460 [Rubripirellula lacrimiformis]